MSQCFPIILLLKNLLEFQCLVQGFISMALVILRFDQDVHGLHLSKLSTSHTGVTQESHRSHTGVLDCPECALVVYSFFFFTLPFPHGHSVAISCNLEKRADPGSLISTAPCPRKSSLLWKGSSSASRTHPAQCLWPCPAVPSASEHVQL